jgi:hypothetical protein
MTKMEGIQEYEPRALQLKDAMNIRVANGHWYDADDNKAEKIPPRKVA